MVVEPLVLLADMKAVVAGNPVADSRELGHSLYTRELGMGRLGLARHGITGRW